MCGGFGAVIIVPWECCARRRAVLGRYASAGKDAGDSADSPTCLALNLADTDVGRPARRLMRAKRREWGSLQSNPGDL